MRERHCARQRQAVPPRRVFTGSTRAAVIGINGNTASVSAADLLSDRAHRVARPAQLQGGARQRTIARAFFH